MFSITEGNLMIRTMQIADVSAYIAKFNYSKELQRRLVLRTKEVLKSQQADDPDLNFTVLENGKIIGGIATRGFEDVSTDAMVQVDVPNATDTGLEQRVKALFLQLVRRDYFYDNIYFVVRNGMGNISGLGRKHQIAGRKVG